MDSLVLFLEGKDGSQKMLCTFSSDTAIVVGKEWIDANQGSLVIPLEGTSHYRDLLLKRLVILIDGLQGNDSPSDDDIRSLECLTTLYSALGKAKPGNRLFSHYHISLV